MTRRNLAIILCGAFLLTLAVVIACQAPRIPAPSPGPQRDMFEGQTCADVPLRGPWCDQFPRIIASNGADVVSDSNNTRLNTFARAHAVLLHTDWPTYYTYTSAPPPQLDPFGYLHDLNPALKFISVLRMYAFAPDQSMCHIPDTYPNRCAIFSAAATANGMTGTTDGWYAKNAAGTIIAKPIGGEYYMNWSDLDPDNAVDSYASWLGNYYTDTIKTAVCDGEPCWDGNYVEMMTIPHALSQFVDVDADENSTADRIQWDKCTLDENQMDGYNLYFDILATGGVTVAGGELSLSGLTDPLANSYTAGHATAAFNGSFPLETWPRCALNPHGGSADAIVPDPAGDPGGNLWDYNMRSAIRWENQDVLNVLMLDRDIIYDSYFGTYFTGTGWDAANQNHARRLVVGSAMLINAYAVPREDRVSNLYPCDECLVDVTTGLAGTDIANLGWAGWPYGDAVEAGTSLTMRDAISDTLALNDRVWCRQYQNAMVCVNTKEIAQTVTVGAGWKYIQASTGAPNYGDGTHNPGGAAGTTINIPAWDATILIRDGAAVPTPPIPYTATPPPAPAPTFTAGPAHTPTPVPDPTETAEPAATATPVPVACGVRSSTIDGNLAEWANATPQYLRASNRAYLAPSAPTPSAADLSSAWWVACSGDNLLIAGIITDSVIINGAGDIFVGDAAEIQIDGLGDGIVRPGQDNHDLFIGPDGRAYDYNLPLSATVVAVKTPGTRWQFELSMALDDIWPGIGNGSIIGKLFGLWDNDITPTPFPGGTPAYDAVDQIMTGYQTNLILPTSTPTTAP